MAFNLSRYYARQCDAILALRLRFVGMQLLRQHPTVGRKDPITRQYLRPGVDRTNKRPYAATGRSKYCTTWTLVMGTLGKLQKHS